MDFEPWAGQYLHYPWSEGVSITATGQEPPVGFEPTTARLRIESSTTELRWRPPNLAACCSTRYSTSSAGDWVAGAYGWLSDIRAPTLGLSGTRRQPLGYDRWWNVSTLSSSIFRRSSSGATHWSASWAAAGWVS